MLLYTHKKRAASHMLYQVVELWNTRILVVNQLWHAVYCCWNCSSVFTKCQKEKNEHYANRGESPKELVALTCSFR